MAIININKYSFKSINIILQNQLLEFIYYLDSTIKGLDFNSSLRSTIVIGILFKLVGVSQITFLLTLNSNLNSIHLQDLTALVISPPTHHFTQQLLARVMQIFTVATLRALQLDLFLTLRNIDAVFASNVHLLLFHLSRSQISTR